MNEFDPSVPHDLSGVIFRDPHMGFSMSFSANLGNAYSGGRVSGTVSRLQAMPGGYIVATIRRTQGQPAEVGTEVRVLLSGWISAELLVEEKRVEAEKGPTPAQEKARAAAVKAVQA